MAYFVAYVIVVALLFTNLFLGVILDAFTAFYDFETSASKVYKKAIAMNADPYKVFRCLSASFSRILLSLFCCQLV